MLLTMLSNGKQFWGVIFVVCTTALAADAYANDSPQPIKHRIMVCEYSDVHRLVEVSSDGKLVWEHKFPSVAVCFRIRPNGNIVFADGGHPTGVIEVTHDHKTVFDYRAPCEQVLCCDLLASGNILLAEQGPCQAVEVNHQGKVVATVKMRTSCVRQLDNGHVLACHEVEGVVREYDRGGKMVWEYPGVAFTYEALRLPSGNTLIGCGTQKRIIEVTPEKRIVWQLMPEDAPELNLAWITSLQVLKNGNFVIANFLRGHEGRGAHAFEVTHDENKKIVWKFADHRLVKSITMVHVLDER